MSQQLPLPVQLPDDETFASFVEGDNALLLQHLGGLLSPQRFDLPFLTFISSAGGEGKSHLMYAMCHACLEQGISHIYLDLHQHREFTSDVLTGLEQMDIVCLDNVQAIADEHDWQVSLFDLINRVREHQRCRLVLSADAAPQQLPLTLPDLASRLTWGVYFSLTPLNDEQRSEVLEMRAQQRGLSMPPEVSRFLLNHLQRDMRSLMQALDTLDQQSLQAQRKLTVPFVKTALGL